MAWEAQVCQLEVSDEARNTNPKSSTYTRLLDVCTCMCIYIYKEIHWPLLSHPGGRAEMQKVYSIIKKIDHHSHALKSLHASLFDDSIHGLVATN